MQSIQNFQNSYLIYTRKSTDDADNQKNSIAYQKSEALRYCKQEQLAIANTDIDNFCTAGIIVERHTGFKESDQFSIGKYGVQHTIERPKFHKLVEVLWKGQFKGVIFLCWDRASRNKSDNAILHRLIEQGKDIRFVQANYDRTSAGELHMDIDGMFAQHYSRIISEKVRNTTLKLRNEGVCTYRAPVGYLNSGDPRNKPLDPVRAPIVKQLFEKYAEGNWSLSDLARFANEQGLTMPAVRRKRTKAEMLKDEEIVIEPVSRPIVINHVHTILRNPFYIGKLRSNDKTYIESISHAPLIDESLFNQVQQMLYRKKVSVHYTDKLNYPYRGLIRCASCGRVYTPYEQKSIHYYGARCSKECTNTKRSINADFIERKVGEVIESLYYCDEELSEINKRVNEDVSVFETQRLNEIEQLQRHQKKIREELTYLRTNKLTLLRTGAYSPEDYLCEESTLNQRLDDLATKIQASDASMHEVMKDLVILSELVKETHKYYSFANPDEKKQIISLLFSELTLSGETLMFKCKKGFEFLSDHSFVFGAPGRNRTYNNGLEVRSYIHLTTGAIIHARYPEVSLLYYRSSVL